MEWLCRTLPALHRPVLVDGKICGNGFDAMYPGNLCIPSQKMLLLIERMNRAMVKHVAFDCWYFLRT
jgi:hypothetical protein